MTRSSWFAEHARTIVILVVCGVVTTGCKPACRPGTSLMNGKCVSNASMATTPQVAADEASKGSASAGSGDKSSQGAGNEAASGAAGGSSKTSASAGLGAKSGAAGTSSGAASTRAPSSGQAAAGNDAGASMTPPAVAMDDGPCAGHGDESFCEDATMHHCVANAEAGAPEKCMSAALCQVGVSMGVCAACVPGTFKCDGAILNQCTDEGQYTMAMECPSAELCREDAGACLDMKCMPNSVTCSSDGKTLKTCNADGSDFASAEPCSAGCNQSLKMCNVCMPGAKSCSGSSLMTCSADGQSMESTECTATGGECSTSTCRNNACVPGVKQVSTACSGGKCDATGRCVACITSADCPDPGPCNTKACALGICTPQPKGEGVNCGSGKECDGAGSCVEKPCGNGRLDPGESCDPKLSSGCTPACKWSNGVYVSCTSVGAPCGNGQGWICSPNGACTNSCTTDDQCKTESGHGACLPFDMAGNNCAVTCSGTRCPINGLPCNQWGPYNICGTWSLMPGGQPMMGPN